MRTGNTSQLLPALLLTHRESPAANQGNRRCCKAGLGGHGGDRQYTRPDGCACQQRVFMIGWSAKVSRARTHSTSTSRSCRQPATLPTCDKRSSSKHRARLMLERGRIEVGEEAARGRRGGGLSGLLGCLHGGPRRHAARVQAAAAAAVGSAGPARGWSKYVTSPHREAGVSPCGWRREHGYNCRRSERAARQGSACKSGR